MKKPTPEELQQTIDNCSKTIKDIDDLLSADYKDFFKLYSQIVPGHYYNWGAYKAIEIISGKWVHPLMMNLFVNGSMRYSELKNAMQTDGITDGTLSNTLRKLVEKGLISKTIYPEVPVRVEYSITQRAYELWVILLQLSKWYNNSEKETAENILNTEYKHLDQQ